MSLPDVLRLKRFILPDQFTLTSGDADQIIARFSGKDSILLEGISIC